MTETFQCGDPGALVAFLYDECEPAEREQIAAHVKQCVSCASEISALGATRRTLAAWRPPDVELGFQITRPGQEAPATVLTPSIPWWRQPLPAWAQAAAAIVIFAAGMSMGVTRGASDVAAPERDSVPDTAVATVSPDDLAKLEERLKNDMAQMRTAPVTPVSASRGDEALMRQVRDLIEQGNEEQRRDFTRRMVDLASTIETQRRVDLQSVRQSVGQLQGVVGTELRQQREVNERFNNFLINVSERTR